MTLLKKKLVFDIAIETNKFSSIIKKYFLKLKSTVAGRYFWPRPDYCMGLGPGAYDKILWISG